MKEKKIVCFGEVLWDVLPDKKLVGGAPLNVAYHLNNFGLPAAIISCVGDDPAGSELLDAINARNIPGQNIDILKDLPTGRVEVKLDENGSPSYDIFAPVAWDAISLHHKHTALVESADALVFGSLACRDIRSQSTLKSLLEVAHLSVFDINLRAPHYDRELIEFLLANSDIVKLNDEEMDVLAKWVGFQGGETEVLASLSRQFKISTLILTKGGDGASCYHEGKLYEQQGFPITVNDTIGSGDSFFAGFLYRFLKGDHPQKCLEFACATGAVVATKAGGTPTLSELEILQLINQQR